MKSCFGDIFVNFEQIDFEHYIIEFEQLNIGWVVLLKGVNYMIKIHAVHLYSRHIRCEQRKSIFSNFQLIFFLFF